MSPKQDKSNLMLPPSNQYKSKSVVFKIYILSPHTLLSVVLISELSLEKFCGTFKLIGAVKPKEDYFGRKNLPDLSLLGLELMNIHHVRI